MVGRVYGWATRPELFNACISFLTIPRVSRPSLRSAALELIEARCALMRPHAVTPHQGQSAHPPNIAELYSSEKYSIFRDGLERILRYCGPYSVVSVLNFLASTLETQPDFAFNLVRGAPLRFLEHLLDHWDSIQHYSATEGMLFYAASRLILSIFTNLSSRSEVLLSLIALRGSSWLQRIEIIERIWSRGRADDPVELVAARANLLRAYPVVTRNTNIQFRELWMQPDFVIKSILDPLIITLHDDISRPPQCLVRWRGVRSHALHLTNSRDFYLDPELITWLSRDLNISKHVEAFNGWLWRINAHAQFASSACFLLGACVSALPRRKITKNIHKGEVICLRDILKASLPGTSLLPVSTVETLFSFLDRALQQLDWPSSMHG
jgi:hypothetical protein